MNPLFRPSDPEEVPERPSLRPRTVRRGRGGHMPLAEELARMAAAQRRPVWDEDEDARETVLESHWGDAAPLEQLLTEERWVPPRGAADPHTEWRDRMPVAFITDAVIDDRTVEDPGTDSRRWREQEAWELNPALPRRDDARATPAPVARSATPVAAAPVPEPEPAPVPPALAAQPPSPPAGLRTLTPPLGKSHRHGLPQLGSWEGSLSSPPAHRMVQVRGGPMIQPLVVFAPPGPTWWDDNGTAVVAGAAAGVVLGALYLLLQML